jgi:hypothetical protein
VSLGVRVSRAGAAVAIAGVAAIAVAAVLGGLYATRASTRTVVVAPCGERTFGHIRSLTFRSGTWVMRFDPAWFTSGRTANVAAAADGVVSPGEPVPNDNYEIEEGHRLLTYLVAPDARVTVITRHGDPAQLGATRITVAQLAALVRGETPIDLFEPLDSGVWIRVDVDTVCAVDQQYRP